MGKKAGRPGEGIRRCQAATSIDYGGRRTMRGASGKAQKEKIRRAIAGYMQNHGYAPTYAEIGEMTGLRSKASICRYIKEMLEEGTLKTDAGIGIPRAITVSGYQFVERGGEMQNNS